MAQKIETDIFLKSDLRDIFNENSIDLSKGDFYETVDEIIAKVAEFVNENYTLKQ